jgi:transposase
MASKFLVPDRDQSFLESVSYRGVLGEDHPVWTVIGVIEGLDLSVVYARYGNDSSVGGRPAFDPKMLLALLVFGYCEGKRSSRALEEACRRDWAYRAICGGMTPDHATIARFRAGLDDILESLFAQVLAVCGEAGLLKVGVVALDGTRMEGAASKEANRTAATLTRMHAEARLMLDEAATADEGEPGGGGGSGKKRRETGALGRMERIGQALQVVAEVVARKEAEEKKRGRPKRPVANVTDPDSRLQKTRRGFIQGYNAQTVVSADQVVIAAEVIADPTDVAMLEPMLSDAKDNLEAAGVTEPIGVALADAGYWSEANAETGPDLGIDLLIATTKTHQVGEPVPDDVTGDDPDRLGVISQIEAGEITVTAAAGQLGLSISYVSKLLARYRHHRTLASTATLARHRMQDKLSVPANRDLYKQRGWLIEGSFAHSKTHRNSGRFLRRGRIACDAEWKLINLAGNLLKLHRYRTNPPPSTLTSCRPHRPHRPPRAHHRQYPPHHPNSHHRTPNKATLPPGGETFPSPFS